MTRAAVPHDFLETNLCPCAQNELGKRTYYLMLVVPARYQCYKVKGMPCVHLLFFRPLTFVWWMVVALRVIVSVALPCGAVA